MRQVLCPVTTTLYRLAELVHGRTRAIDDPPPLRYCDGRCEFVPAPPAASACPVRLLLEAADRIVSQPGPPTQ